MKAPRAQHDISSDALQSKTANIWFANELEKRYGSQGIHATSVHPGKLLHHLILAFLHDGMHEHDVLLRLG